MSSALIYKMRLKAPNMPGTASHNSNYVKYIGYLAFNGCRNLKEVTMSKGTIFDKDTFPEGVNIRYRENEQEQSEPEEEEGFEPEI